MKLGPLWMALERSSMAKNLMMKKPLPIVNCQVKRVWFELNLAKLFSLSYISTEIVHAGISMLQFMRYFQRNKKVITSNWSQNVWVDFKSVIN